MFTKTEIKEMLKNYKFRVAKRKDIIIKNYTYDIPERIFNVIKNIGYVGRESVIKKPDDHHLKIQFDIRKVRNKNIFIPTLKISEPVIGENGNNLLINTPIESNKEDAKTYLEHTKVALDKLESDLKRKNNWIIKDNIRNKIKTLSKEWFNNNEEVKKINIKRDIIHDRIRFLYKKEEPLIKQINEIEKGSLKEIVKDIKKNNYTIPETDFDSEIIKECIEENYTEFVKIL
jgi:hypothetical protein